LLVLSRREGQWVEITHRSGDVLRICVSGTRPGAANLAFQDDQRFFSIQRPERRMPPPITPAEAATDA
jgi:hypothetical protein